MRYDVSEQELHVLSWPACHELSSFEGISFLCLCFQEKLKKEKFDKKTKKVRADCIS